MRYLRDKKNRFLQVLNKYENLYKHTSKEEYLIVSNGILNFIWNNWNNLWKDYWLAHINGGIYIDSVSLHKIYNYNDKQSLHYLCYLSGKFTKHNAGQSIIGTHQEITWGDFDKIEKIANEIYTLFPHLTHINYLLSLIGTYKNEIQQFQLIRNSFIHLNNENMKKLDSIRSHYIFTPDQSLIEILESTHISSNKKCINHLIDNMRGLIVNL
ncbi:MAG: hypothetical protein LC112_13180 [Flavobacteriales bacterium]|nr:hypothetical protein [Flavobacteriales bacterium]